MSNSATGRNGALHVLVTVAAIKVILDALRNGTLSQRQAAADLLESAVPVVILADALTED